MNQVKIERINSSLQEQISYILATEVKNPDIKFVTITGVKTASDLGSAKVYFTVLDNEKRKQTLDALKGASGFIRKELCDRVEIRKMPEISFVYDTSIEYGNKIEQILEEIKKEDSSNGEN